MAYVIITTREFYGPKTVRTLYSDDSNRANQYDTIKAAKTAIKEIDSGRYYLAHNESSRPSYKACRVDSLPRYLQDQL